MYEIENGIPIQSKLENLRKYPLREMEVGDSFFIPSVGTNKIGGRFSYLALRLGIKITVRNVDGGVRVWRIA